MSALRLARGGMPVSTGTASDVIRTAGKAAADNRAADRERFRKRGDHVGRVVGPTAGRVLVTRTDIGSRNASLTTSVRGTGRKNPARSDVASVRFGDGDKRHVITATKRDRFGNERPAPAEHRHFHRHADGSRCECPHE